MNYLCSVIAIKVQFKSIDHIDMKLILAIDLNYVSSLSEHIYIYMCVCVCVCVS